MMNEPETLAWEAQALSAQIKPLLAGRGPDVQGAVLADLVSTFLLGHISTKGEKATRALREEMFELWQDTVWKLVALER